MWSKIINFTLKNQVKVNNKFLCTTAKCAQSTQLKRNEDVATKEYTDTPRPAQVKTKKKFSEPYPKSIFVGSCDPNVLEYPEVLNLQEIDKVNDLAKNIESSIKYEVEPGDSGAKGVFSKSAREKIAEFRLCGSKLPQHYHGWGFTETETAVVNEAISSDCNLYKFVSEQQCLSGALLAKYGSEDQKLRYLIPLAQGKSVISCAYQESTALSEDTKELETIAVPCGDGSYEIIGTKMWVYNAAVADALIVIANTVKRDDTGQHSGGLTAFILPVDTPGITIHPPITNFALHATSASQVEFKNVKAPADAMLGKLNDGNEMVQSTLCDKFDLAPLIVGVGKNLIDDVTNYTIHTSYMGATLNELEGVKARLGRMTAVLYVLESALYLQKGHADLYENSDIFMELCIMKVLSSKTLDFLLSESIQLLGADAVSNTKYSYLQKLLIESAYYASCDETNLNLKSAIALNGLQHAGLTLHEEIKKVRNPLLFPSYIMKRIFQGKKRYGGPKGKDLGLAGYLHPTLEESAHMLEYCISRVHLCTELLLGRYGQLVVDKHVKLAYLADAAIAIYALTATLGRASRSYCIGLAESNVEMEIAVAVATYTKSKVNKLTELIEGGSVANCTTGYIAVSERVLFNKQYCIQRPIARNF